MPKISSNRVIIVWSTPDHLEDGIVHVLDSYTGTRVYERDQYDGRLGSNVPYYEKFVEAVEYMRTNPNKPVQIPYDVGKKLNLT